MSWLAGLEHCVRENESMAPRNWLRLGGAAQYFAEPTTVSELSELLKRTQTEGISVRLLGAGSNILVGDEGVKGVVIHLSAPAFCRIQTVDQEITAGAGLRLNHVVATAAGTGLAGLEAFVGIPSSVGGALRTNAIGHGAAIGQWTHSVTAMSRAGETVRLESRDLRFGYHHSNLGDLVILDGTFELERGDTTKITRQMQKLWILRRANLPSSEVGHVQVFANPRGLTAGEIIEQVGLKGRAIGGASISEVDANFIEVQPNTSSSDVIALIDQVRLQVSEKLGVDLQPQIDVW